MAQAVIERVAVKPTDVISYDGVTIPLEGTKGLIGNRYMSRVRVHGRLFEVMELGSLTDAMDMQTWAMVVLDLRAVR